MYSLCSLLSLGLKNRMHQKSSDNQNKFTQFAVACAQKVSLPSESWSENIFKDMKMFVNVICAVHTQSTCV